jgi:hypothetical protein
VSHVRAALRTATVLPAVVHHQRAQAQQLLCVSCGGGQLQCCHSTGSSAAVTSATCAHAFVISLTWCCCGVGAFAACGCETSALCMWSLSCSNGMRAQQALRELHAVPWLHRLFDGGSGFDVFELFRGWLQWCL